MTGQLWPLPLFESWAVSGIELWDKTCRGGEGRGGEGRGGKRREEKRREEKRREEKRREEKRREEKRREEKRREEKRREEKRREEKDPKSHLIPALPCQGHLPPSQAPSSLALGTSRDPGAATASLGIPSQPLPILPVMILGAQGKEISLGGEGIEGILRDELLHSSKRKPPKPMKKKKKKKKKKKVKKKDKDNTQNPES
ncbi:hypothetical protein HGM15179_011868 [Zosterops borbonicus]|uniref:Uncharacterized protein n=1 Tax=Zosterops borbonicus TaxID=364589 RepID=A0A8K1GAU6_9PASS|nr:hypothetical protein HGM15179_011868 [Zosterops borbonicus]